MAAPQEILDGIAAANAEANAIHESGAYPPHGLSPQSQRAMLDAITFLLGPPAGSPGERTVTAVKVTT